MGDVFTTLIMATYRRGDRLRVALDCLAASTWRPEEIIIVSDGDSAAKPIVENYSWAHYLEVPHGGVYKAWNTAIKLSKGNFITFMGDDDMVTTTYYNDMINAIKADEYKHNFYYQRWAIARGRITGKLLWRTELKAYDELSAKNNFPVETIRTQTGRLPSGGSFIRRSLYDIELYNMAFSACEDTFWFIRRAIDGTLKPLRVNVEGYTWYRNNREDDNVSRKPVNRRPTFRAMEAYLRERGYAW